MRADSAEVAPGLVPSSISFLYPVAQCLGVGAELLGDAVDCAAIRFRVFAEVEGHSSCPFAQFCGVALSRRHKR